MNATSTTTSRVAPPSRLLRLLELRAAWELAAGFAALPWLRLAPRGDGHPVLVLPGLIASDRSTHLLRYFLARRGYEVHGWGLGRNYGPRPSVEEAMLATIDKLHAASGRQVSLIGQSLGGAYARVLAAQRPDAVRCVVTLGSPIGGHPRASNAWRIYEFTSGESSVDPRRWQQVTQTPQVPTTAIYSRSDGVVAWQNSVQPGGPRTESIEVVSSHIGMAVHPAVLYAVADRLAQSEGQWQPFELRGWRAALYPRPGSPR
jgi:pimeloyl-ACP methyl ester carboxylesterase